MELWATGFNAWNQLQFDEASTNEAHDLMKITCILRESSIKILKTSRSATLVQTPTGIKVAGDPDNCISAFRESHIDQENITVAGNDKICEFEEGSIRQYRSLKDYREGNCEAFENLGQIKQVVANETSFTALSSTGLVYTWGDERYRQCLGREITKENPASKPSIVENLVDLEDRTSKISSGGYASAALTSANDVYFWGEAGEPKDMFCGSPTPLDLNGEDILDVTIGFNHIAVLTAEGNIFVVGEGSNGQLGLDVKRTEIWEQLLVPLKEGQKITGVYAGYKNTFLLIKNTTD